MLTSGNALTGADSQSTGTCGLCIFGQINSLVVTRKVAASFAHVFKRIGVGLVVLYCFTPGCIEIACKAIPHPQDKGAVQTHWQHEPECRLRYSSKEYERSIANCGPDDAVKTGDEVFEHAH